MDSRHSDELARLVAEGAGRANVDNWLALLWFTSPPADRAIALISEAVASAEEVIREGHVVLSLLLRARAVVAVDFDRLCDVTIDGHHVQFSLAQFEAWAAAHGADFQGDLCFSESTERTGSYVRSYLFGMEVDLGPHGTDYVRAGYSMAESVLRFCEDNGLNIGRMLDQIAETVVPGKVGP